MDLAGHSPVPAPQHLQGRYGPLVLVGDDSIDRRLEVGEQRKPDAGADAVGLSEDAVVRERVIIEEQTGRDVERDEDVNGVVLVRREDEEDRKHVQDPAQRVQQRDSTRSVCHAYTCTHTHTHNHFTALLEYVRDHPGEQVPER